MTVDDDDIHFLDGFRALADAVGWVETHYGELFNPQGRKRIDIVHWTKQNFGGHVVRIYRLV